MRRAEVILAAALAFSLTGCVFGGKKPVAVAAAPPAPKPEPPPAPAPLPEPTSIPQTTIQLPEPQPISPEALATTRPSEEPASPATQPRTPPRRAGTPAPKPQAPGPAAPAPAAATPPVTAPAEAPPVAVPEETPRLQEAIDPGESNRLKDAADARRREAVQIVDQLNPRSLSSRQKNLLPRVRSFLKQSEEAGTRGDMRQAFELAGRALVLAKELQAR